MNSYDIYGIGNALVDIEYMVDESSLVAESIAKGHMTLVDEERIETLQARLCDQSGGEQRRLSGGSAANTVYAVQAFGGRAFYSCRVAQDETGRHFLADMAAAGVGTAGQRPTKGQTGRCLTLITADAERTMATYLGVSATLAPEDVDEASLAGSSYLYIEGYLAAADTGTAAAVSAREIAESANVKTSLSLSDPAMVENCRDCLEQMLGNGVDQLFCNEEEALSWAGTDRLDIAIVELGDIAPLVYVTLGARGSLAARRGKSQLAAPHPAEPVDTTGAGDIYAGGVIHAQIKAAEPVTAARFGNFVAAQLVARHGARLPSVADYATLRAKYRP